jgi:hypothetical protein
MATSRSFCLASSDHFEHGVSTLIIRISSLKHFYEKFTLLALSEEAVFTLSNWQPAL